LTIRYGDILGVHWEKRRGAYIPNKGRKKGEKGKLEPGEKVHWEGPSFGACSLL